MHYVSLFSKLKILRTWSYTGLGHHPVLFKVVKVLILAHFERQKFEF